MGLYMKDISNASYTNKDFNTIYSELLDIADELSPTWKPSQSAESDPGVVLLKLDALMADKNNYNIDKNILELFPESVTQYANAREIFEQCGYVMPYYNAASVDVNLVFSKDPDDIKLEEDETSVYHIPQFTMICDDSKNVVYTLIEEAIISSSNQILGINNASQKTVKALQGRCNDYKFNTNSSTNKITYDNLDYNNRLYFRESNVAENGIFIQNIVNGIPSENFSDWLKVDNLVTQEHNTTCYKFGISKDNRCYIEFPDDIANLIGEGIAIKYLTTSGVDGNIGDSILSKFFTDLTVSVDIYTAEGTIKDSDDSSKLNTTITSDNIYIDNLFASENGSNPQSIEAARISYERVKNTFDTLVSLRDYSNFVRTSGEVSNGFVCDRTNDVQSSYKVMTITDNGSDKLVSKVATSVEGDPEMTAFDLKIYALKYMNPVTDMSRFDITFTPVQYGVEVASIISDMEDVKSIQHDFQPLAEDKIMFIQLQYPIEAKIIPYNKLGARSSVHRITYLPQA